MIKRVSKQIDLLDYDTTLNPAGCFEDLQAREFGFSNCQVRAEECARQYEDEVVEPLYNALKLCLDKWMEDADPNECEETLKYIYGALNVAGGSNEN